MRALSAALSAIDEIAEQGDLTPARTPSEPLALETGFVTHGLRAVGAVFGASAGLDRQQRAHLHGIRLVVGAVDFLCAKHQVAKGKREQGFYFGDGPIVAYVGHAHPFNR